VGCTYLPKPRAPRYHSLDMCRGLACLSVVIYHACHNADFSTIPALRMVADVLWAGVPIFFVVSGYCISATADSARRKPASPPWQRFMSYFYRRFRRILPPYWFCLALTAAAGLVAVRLGYSGMLPSPYRGSRSWLGNILLVESFRPDGRWLLPQAWTLVYEEQFYAVCGLLLLIYPHRFFLGAAAVSLVGVATAALYYLFPATPLGGTFLDGYWLLFAAGVGVYWQSNYGGQKSGAALAGLLLAGCLVGLGLRVSTPALSHEIRWLAEGLTVACAFAGILLVLKRWDSRLAGAPLLKPLSWCGAMCYSLYLTHWPVVLAIEWLLRRAGLGNGVGPTLLMTIPSCLTASLITAAGFYWLVERRFLNAPQSPKVPSEPAFTGVTQPAPPVLNGSTVAVPACRA
jgi:peptidoglycan/LPS O-acetylase OafA/YrhL